MKSQTIEVSGIRTRFLESGTGEPIVILHGWGPDIVLEESFGHLTEKLSKKFRVLLVALPGFDGSEFPPKGGWTTHQYGEWLGELLKVLKPSSPALYGHSFGCRVIVRFLVQNPDFTGKIILTGAAGIKWDPETGRQKFMFAINKHFPGFKKFFRKACPQVLRPLILGKLLGAHDWAYVPEKLEKTLQKTLAEPDFREELGTIKNQVLLIWGEDDSVTPLRSAQVFAKMLPHAQLQVLKEGRHGIHKTHDEEISKLVIRFLHEK
ncbi:alpha/beta hydrolase [Candidatus Gracilibacteria bacterium]|nr:alpha/beta hydrolase [Candidatus Gracilibacteria bacterium]